jgi:hypothetical protein
VVVVGGGWLESKRSDQLWLSFSLALAKPKTKRQETSAIHFDTKWILILHVFVCQKKISNKLLVIKGPT